MTAPTINGTSLVRVADVTKRYGGISALDDVSLSIEPGRVVALCGGNGAGKSTLVKILAGVETADAGTIFVKDRPERIHSPADAAALGFSFIHQELNLVPRFSAVQNMSLGWDRSSRWGWLDSRAARRRAEEVLDQLDAGVPLDIEVSRLTVSQRWMVSLGRSLMREARMIAMDEPTASFTDREAEKLFSIVSDLKADGVAILYISHRLDEVLEISDEVSILRNGRLIGTFPAQELSRADLTQHIVGGEVKELVRDEQHRELVADHDLVIQLRDLTCQPRVRGVNLDVKAGEILGIAGLVGSGRTELARLLFGADRPTSGSMKVNGRPFSPKAPFDAIKRGVAMVPEERRSEGLILRESVAFNINLATMSKATTKAIPLVSMEKLKEAARDTVSRFGIKLNSVSQPISDLSGGNQQKALVGRYVRTEPSILILDEPTVGVDVGARSELYEIVRELNRQGTTIILICSDFEELAICDRVAVMREGVVTHIVEGESATKDRLTSLCYAGSQEDS